MLDKQLHSECWYYSKSFVLSEPITRGAIESITGPFILLVTGTNSMIFRRDSLSHVQPYSGTRVICATLVNTGESKCGSPLKPILSRKSIKCFVRTCAIYADHGDDYKAC